MTSDLILALAAFAFVSSVTPGPNNLMLMASGANFGFRRSIPHMLGVGIGFTLMVVLVGIGLSEVFNRVPLAYGILKAVSVVYLLWLAYRIAVSRPGQQERRSDRPLTFLEAAAFQWVNPKGWTMALTAISVYAPDTTLLAIAVVAVIFGAINLPTVSTWTILGQQIAKLLHHPTHQRVFNIGMAGLLVASLYPVLAP